MSQTTILIVEDEAIVAADLAGKLERLGYEVAGIAASGEEAIAMADRLRPHLVLMDIWLEGAIDGVEAAATIGSRHDVPVIYLTAHSDAATLARAKLTGPFGYILKPFEERDLATQIDLAFYKHHADRQVREHREWLRVTLSSIGDAVIATDSEGHVTFLNPVAAGLTGWQAEEAAGQPVKTVFRMINEQSGQPLEDPVARVLWEGRAVELLTQRFPWSPPPVLGDLDLLLVAFYNLIDNACKFGGSDDSVQVRISEDGATVLVEIADNGPGIAEADLPHVFEELYRGNGARGIEGSGLGLALVKKIVERHGGSVAVRSRPGQGTVFTVRLPAGPAR